MNIRIADPRDAVRLAELRWQFRTERKDPTGIVTREDFIAATEQFIYDALMSQDWAVWVAEEDGVILSHAFVETILKLPKLENLHPAYGYVTNVYTIPERRGLGIGRMVMEQILDWARTRKMEMLILWPSKVAVGFYERLGFSRKNDAMELDLEE